jgi:hypothetical protein
LCCVSLTNISPKQNPCLFLGILLFWKSKYGMKKCSVSVLIVGLVVFVSVVFMSSLYHGRFEMQELSKNFLGIFRNSLRSNDLRF